MTVCHDCVLHHAVRCFLLIGALSMLPGGLLCPNWGFRRDERDLRHPHLASRPALPLQDRWLHLDLGPRHLARARLGPPEHHGPAGLQLQRQLDWRLPLHPRAATQRGGFFLGGGGGGGTTTSTSCRDHVHPCMTHPSISATYDSSFARLGVHACWMLIGARVHSDGVPDACPSAGPDRHRGCQGGSGTSTSVTSTRLFGP